MTDQLVPPGVQIIADQETASLSRSLLEALDRTALAEKEQRDTGAPSAKLQLHRDAALELVQRTQRLRWRRHFEQGLLGATSDALPSVKRNRSNVGPLATPVGWADLLDATTEWLKELMPGSDWSMLQAKEKFGVLRVRWNGELSQSAAAVMQAAEQVSSHVCEVCGAPGTLRDNGRRWVTNCDEHADLRV